MARDYLIILDRGQQAFSVLAQPVTIPGFACLCGSYAAPTTAAWKQPQTVCERMHVTIPKDLCFQIGRWATGGWLPL